MQAELIEQIIHLPIPDRIEIIERISRSVREDLRENNSQQTSLKEKKAAIETLRGVAKSENPLLSKQEVREDYYNYLAEKYK